jgi:hypothetical protein
MSMSKKDALAVVCLVVFVGAISWVNYTDKTNCEVARPNYECVTITSAIAENCNYLDTNGFHDEGIKWYVVQLCKLQNKAHNGNIDCTNPVDICQSIRGM